MRCFVAVIGLLVVPILGCGLHRIHSESHAVERGDYGPPPTDYNRMVEQHIQFEYDLETSIYGKEWFGPQPTSHKVIGGGEAETFYGYEIHVWFTNNVHYMVLIRDGQIVGSEECGERSEGFLLTGLLIGSISC